MARSASILCTTPRVGLNIINNSNVLLDGLIGSNLDPGEVFSFSELSLKPKYTIKTEGEKGGIIFPGGRYKALKNKKLKVDSYGCGDSFAAGILYGMASKWDIEKSLNLAKVMGRDASEFFGPYANSVESNWFKTYMSNLDNKNKNLLVENIIVFFLFTVFLVFNSLKTLSKIFTYGIIKKEILTTKSDLGVDIKIKIK